MGANLRQGEAILLAVSWLAGRRGLRCLFRLNTYQDSLYQKFEYKSINNLYTNNYFKYLLKLSASSSLGVGRVGNLQEAPKTAMAIRQQR